MLITFCFTVKCMVLTHRSGSFSVLCEAGKVARKHVPGTVLETGYCMGGGLVRSVWWKQFSVGR